MLISGIELQYAAENTNMNQHVRQKKAILRQKSYLKQNAFVNSVNDIEKLPAVHLRLYHYWIWTLS